MSVTLADVESAARRIAGSIVRTPSAVSERLSETTGARVVVKLENLHATGSFKERGAVSKLLTLSADERRRGVVANSAGNHGQALAYHASRLGVPATIVMPASTPNVKVDRTRALGAEVELLDGSVTEAEDRAHELALERSLVFVHPFDDPAVIAGQGTVGLELLEDHPELDLVVVPVGGGGLIAGIAVAVRSRYPDVEVIGVQSERYPAMVGALTGRRAECGGSTIAEGIAVPRVGRLTLELVRELVTDVVAVRESSIEEALNLLLFEEKTVTEGAGAAPLALVLEQPERFAGRTVGLVISGGNVDPRILSQVVLRGLVRAGLLVTLEVVLPDAPGALGVVAGLVGSGGANIVDVTHHRLFDDVAIKSAVLSLVIETRGPAHVAQLVSALDAAGYPAHIRSGQQSDAAGVRARGHAL